MHSSRVWVTGRPQFQPGSLPPARALPVHIALHSSLTQNIAVSWPQSELPGLRQFRVCSEDGSAQSLRTSANTPGQLPAKDCEVQKGGGKDPCYPMLLGPGGQTRSAGGIKPCRSASALPGAEYNRHRHHTGDTS